MSWWPTDVPPSQLVTRRYAFYQCGARDRPAFLAILVGGGEAHYWQP
jgi:hypothetical protein